MRVDAGVAVIGIVFSCSVLQPYDLIIIGLFSDVAGAFVLASSFMMKTPVDAADEAATRSGQNIALFRSTIFQRAEAWCGATLLGLGFALQVIGNYRNASVPAGLGVLNTWQRVGGTGVVVWLGARLWLMAWRFDAQERFLEHVFASLPPEQMDATVPPSSAFRMARLWGVRPLPNETADELAVRLTACRQQFVLRYSELAQIHGISTAASMRDRYR
jgi:hypothetical protein